MASVAAVAVVAIIITMRIVATEEEEEEEEETETAAAVAQERTRGRIDRAGAILCLAFYSNAVVVAEEARGRAGGGAAVPSARLAMVDRVEAKKCGCSRRCRRYWCRSIGTPAARLLNYLILPANNTQ